MTVSASSYQPVAYVGNGVTVAFAVTFTFSAETDIVVTERTIATGAEVVKTLTTDYTVSGGSGSTGTVTAVIAPASTVQWIIARNTPVTQGVDFSDNDPFPAETLEGALDKLTRTVQEVEHDASRALRFPATDSTSLSAILPNSVTRAGKLLQFTSSNGEPEAVAAADLDLTVVTAFIQTLLDDPDAATALATLGGQADLDVPSQAEAEAGNATTERVWTAERIGQAIAALITPSDKIELRTATRDVSTASGTQDITGFTFDPKAALVIAAVDSSTRVSFGIFKNSGAFSVSWDAAGNAHPQIALLDIISTWATDRAYCQAATITNGIRLTWTKAGSPTGTATIYVWGVK